MPRMSSCFGFRLAMPLREAKLFGSRARGTHRPDSDVDVAVVLRGPRGAFLSTKLDMVDIAFDVLMETGIYIQAMPIWECQCANWSLPHPSHALSPCVVISSPSRSSSSLTRNPVTRFTIANDAADTSAVQETTSATAFAWISSCDHMPG
jgi:hypothetical protein